MQECIENPIWYHWLFTAVYLVLLKTFFPVTCIMPVSLFGVGETGEECGSAS